MSDIISTFKNTRKSLGISQRELGCKMHLPQSHISQIENGNVDLRLSSLVELSRVLGLEVILVPRNLVHTIDGLLNKSSSNALSPWQPDEDSK